MKPQWVFIVKHSLAVPLNRGVRSQTIGRPLTRPGAAVSVYLGVSGRVVSSRQEAANVAVSSSRLAADRSATRSESGGFAPARLGPAQLDNGFDAHKVDLGEATYELDHPVRSAGAKDDSEHVEPARRKRQRRQHGSELTFPVIRKTG